MTAAELKGTAKKLHTYVNVTPNLTLSDCADYYYGPGHIKTVESLPSDKRLIQMEIVYQKQPYNNAVEY